MLLLRKWTLLTLLFCTATKLFAQSLPDDMPPFTVTLNNTQADGYLFVTPIDMTTPNSNWPSTILLLDAQGSPVFYMPVSSANAAPYPRKAIGNFQIHNNGLMSFTDALFGPDENIIIMDSSFTIIDTLTCTPPYKLDGHDFVFTDDGHYHLLAMEERILDMSALVTESGPNGDTNCVVTGHIIQEFDENKILVGEWKSLDHFALDDIYWYNFVTPSSVDHAHVNSLFVDHDGNYVISSRSLNEVTRINRSTGDIMWRLGGKNNEFTLFGDTTQFTAQHDAQYFPDGTVLIFDNGTFTEPDKVARLLTYQLDTVAMTANELVNFWHPDDFYSGFMGSYRNVGPNHKLVCWGGGYNYSIGKAIQEYDQFWNETMAVDFEDGVVSYRALKAEIPWSINRPEIVCDGFNSSLSGPANATSYLWSTGDTTESITITAVGTYQLWTNQGDGFISSEPFEVVDLNDLCETSGFEDLPHFDLTIFPNPFSDQLTVEIDGASINYLLEIASLDGKMVYATNFEGTTHSFRTEQLNSGMYLLTVKTNGKTVAVRRIVKE